jgi:hypothetical protein
VIKNIKEEQGQLSFELELGVDPGLLTGGITVSSVLFLRVCNFLRVYRHVYVKASENRKEWGPLRHRKEITNTHKRTYS